MQTTYNPQRKRPVVKLAKLPDIVMEGHPVIVGEYRGTSSERIDYVDKSSGKAAFFIKIAHTIELNHPNGAIDPITVQERAPKGFETPAEYKSGVSKGQLVVCRLQSLQRIKGAVVGEIGEDESSLMLLDTK